MFAKLFELRNKKLKDNKKKGFTLIELADRSSGNPCYFSCFINPGTDRIY